MKNRKPKENKNTYYFFKSLSYIKPYKGRAIACLISCALFAGLSVFVPVYTEKTLTAFTNSDGTGLLINASLLLLFQVLSSLTHLILWGNNADKLKASITKDIRYNTLDSILRLKIKNFDIYGTGRMVQVISSDTNSLASIYNCLVDVFMSILSNFAIVIYIFASNIFLGLYCILEFVVVALIFRIRLKIRLRDQVEQKKTMDRNTSLVMETIKGVRDIKNYNIHNSVMEKANESLTALQNIEGKFGSKQYRLYRTSIIIKNVMAFLFIPLALLLIHLDITTFATAFTIFVFRNSITSLIDWFMMSWEYFKDGGMYAKRIFDVLNGYEEGFEKFPKKDNFKELPEHINIDFKNLTFSYNGVDNVLNDFNLHIEHGTKIAFVSASGGGKSTLLKLINKTYDVDRGQIFIGEHDICDFSKETLRDIITIVPQEPYIFNFSILDNLKIIKPDATKEEIENACKKAQIHDYIMSLPKKYNTMLGEGGSRFSGGQKQRLSIARALLKDSPILIFDEATSALDNENQNAVKEVVDNIGNDKIVITVAHRLSTIVDADKIYFMKNGQIIAGGTHREMLKTCEEYKCLYRYENAVAEDNE